ncbi:MAG TPA: choice-of-anchor Q domain-containing protein [Puia sp.]|nr:choice-of-anchor Q domain-containing protein [Puia sp.]
MRSCLTTLYLCLILSFPTFARTYYVNAGATGIKSGDSWADAFTNLRWALEFAQSGDTIKVAAGIYLPSSVGYGDSTFSLIRGVCLLGGYPNTGNPGDANRDWVNQQTILRGNGTNSVIVTAAGIDTATVMDGFFVQEGYAGQAYDGTGMQVTNSGSLVFRHLIFQYNYNNAVALNNGQAIFTDCVMDQNSNGALSQAGGSNTTFYNCIFSANSFGSALNSQNSDIRLVNCTVVNNTGAGYSGGGTGTATFRNTIFWNNLVNYSELNGDILPNGQTIDAANCITQTYAQSAAGTLLVNYNPRFFNIANPAGADGKFFTADDGLQLTAPCSPAINSGDNSAAAEFTTDILGNPRIFNGGTVDLGAYELQIVAGPPLTTVYVNAAATGAGNGSSWQDAYPTLQQAMLYCADTIKVAAGTYLTANSSRDSVFKLESGKVILGGYPATGNPTDPQRSPAANRTLLQSNYKAGEYGAASPVLEAFHSDSNTRIDGFVFSNGSSLTYDGGFSAPALHIGFGSKVRVTNCQFSCISTDGSTSSSGILITDTSTPVITRSTLTTNMTTFNYLGAAVLSLSQSSPAISYCQFTGNGNTDFSSIVPSATGRALLFDHSSGSVDSCTFTLSLGSGDAMVSAVAGNPSISNCVFSGKNSTGYQLANAGGGNSIVNNCVFKNWFASGAPSAVHNDNSSPIFSKCLFDSTSYSISNVNHSNPVFNNCVSVNGQFMQNTNSRPTLNNCTIVNAYGNPQQGFVNLNEQALILNNDSSVLTANNTIFWGSKLANGWKDVTDTFFNGNEALGSHSVLTNCVTRNTGTNGVNGNLVGIDPRLVQLSDPYGPDGKLFTADDGIRPALCSPAVNAGSNSIGKILSTDILNNPRIFNGTVDIGAYELEQIAPANMHSYYVNANAAAGGSGLNWANAYSDLQSAVCNVCADTIRVAAGTYKPAVIDRDSSFVIGRPLSLLGGYPSTGIPTDAQRDPAANTSTLSGDLGNPGDSSDNSKTIISVIGVPDSVTIDGFTVRDGYNAFGGIGLNAVGGAAVYTYNNKTIIRNCQFLHNHSGPAGGAIAFGGLDTCYISHSVFAGNSATDYGGAIASAGAYLGLANCVFDGNYAYGEGGALQLRGTFDIKGCVFFQNYTTATNVAGKGGAVDDSYGGGTIANCTFVKNRSAYQYPEGGGGVFTNFALGAIVRNCIFAGNSSGGSTTGQATDIDWEYNTVFHCLLQYSHGAGNGTNLAPATIAFTDSVLPLGRDGKWLTADDGLQLLYNSPAVNFGDNSAVTGLTTDILANPRIVDGTVDAGAYEYQDKPFADAGPDTLVCNDDTARVGRGGDPKFAYTWTSLPAGYHSTNATAVVQPAVPTTYFLSVTDGTTTSTDSIRVSVTDSLRPTVSMFTDTSMVCAGANVVFTAVGRNGGDSSAYQWQVNGANVGTNSPQFSSSTLADSSKVAVFLTSSLSCAKPKTVGSNTINMRVQPVVAPSLTIGAAPGPTCVGNEILLLASPVNGGDHPTFFWNTSYANYQTTTDSLLLYIVDSTEVINVQMTSSNGCAITKTAYSNKLVLHSNSPVTPSVTIVAAHPAICASDDDVFTANPVNGGISPAYQWLVNGKDVGGNDSVYDATGLENGDLVSVVMTANGICVSPSTATSNTVPVTVSPAVTPSVSIKVTPAASGKPYELNALLVYGGNIPRLEWQDSTDATGWQAIAGGNTDTISYLPAPAGAAVRCLLTSSLQCTTQQTDTSAVVRFNLPGGYVTSDGGGIRYYPNPVLDLLTVDSLQRSDGWQLLEILDINGQTMRRIAVTGLTMVTVDMIGLPRGIYVLCIFRQSGSTFYRRLLKM